MIVSLTPDPHPTMLSDGTTNIVYGIGNEQIHTVTAGTATWFTHDHLGSTRQTVTETGTVAGSARYDAWGAPLENTTGSRFGFTGELTDNGLVYLRARWYNPSTGVFLSRDPFPGVDTVPQSLHPYAYTHNNPVNATDPSGMCRAGGDDWCREEWTRDRTGGAGKVGAGAVFTAPQLKPYTGKTQPLGRLPSPGGSVRGPGIVAIVGACIILYSGLLEFLDSVNPPFPNAIPSPGPESIPSDPRLARPESTYTRTVLVVGENRVDYSRALANRHPDWYVIGSNYGDGSNSQSWIGISGNHALVRNVDAARLHEGDYTKTQQFDDIIWTGPRATSGWDVETAALLDRVFPSAWQVLKPGGALRFTSAEKWPSWDALMKAINNRPTGYSNSYTALYELDGRFGVPFVHRRNNDTRIDSGNPIYWFAFQKGG
jgi:RHS repeat-associated protein